MTAGVASGRRFVLGKSHDRTSADAASWRTRAHFLVAARRRDRTRNLFHVARRRGAWGRQLAAAALGLGEARDLVRRNGFEQRFYAPGCHLGSNEERESAS